MSVNLELPSKQSLKTLAPEKSKEDILSPMRQIKHHRAEDADTRALKGKYNYSIVQNKSLAKKERAFVPAGQSTQMIIGASPESDFHILNLSASLYKTLSLKRVFFSAYLPVNKDPLLPGQDAIQLNREHRLYQADWLLRFYKFDVSEIINEDNPFLDPLIDPKANWALNNLDFFPLEVNTATLEQLLRVPGIGAKGARTILRVRKQSTLHEHDLQKLGIAYKRARYFITCNGIYSGLGISFTKEGLRAKLAAPIQGGAHGRRSSKALEGQLSLFESVEVQKKGLIHNKSQAFQAQIAASNCNNAKVAEKGMRLPEQNIQFPEALLNNWDTKLHSSEALVPA